jgi:hypothetical protein
MTPLERVAQAQLHDARGHGRLEFPKLAGVIDVQNGVIEVHMIEGVECLRPERDAMPFPGQRESLHDRNIDVLNARKPDDSPGAGGAAGLLEVVVGRRGALKHAGHAVIIDELTVVVGCAGKQICECADFIIGRVDAAGRNR